jgi:branched-chain amino acid transport system permease protein
LSPTVENVLIFGVSLTLMIALTYIVTRTRVGKAIRAVSFDADAASLMGINTDRVIAFTFMLGASLAGAAGVLVFGLQHTHFDPYVGILYGLKAFVAAVLGGIGNIPGAVLGGIIMGLAETLVVAYGPRVGIDSTYRDAVAFLLLIVILLLRPAGLLGSFAPEKV